MKTKYIVAISIILILATVYFYSRRMDKRKDEGLYIPGDLDYQNAKILSMDLSYHLHWSNDQFDPNKKPVNLSYIRSLGLKEIWLRFNNAYALVKFVKNSFAFTVEIYVKGLPKKVLTQSEIKPI